MEVDHFNPNKKRDYVQAYDNLFLATRHCNSAKRDRWPTSKQRTLGIRFLNCCKEADYGVHIFEDPDTHEVVGVTPAGRYHVRSCDLNAQHLVDERAERAALWLLLETKPITEKTRVSTKVQTMVENRKLLLECVEAIRHCAEAAIPKIPYLSGEALNNHRALKQALAAPVLK
jgi:hypothetical protein